MSTKDHWLRDTKARRLRRAYPIHAYVGPNGHGKSLAAVWDTMPTLAKGRPVLSTLRFLDWQNPRPCDDPLCFSPNHAVHAAAHPLWVPLTDWPQLLEAEHCDVVMDEVTGIASSRESSSMPPAVANLLVQLRRRDVVLRWTAPSWARADKIIRECSQAVTAAAGYMPVPTVVEGEDDEREWSQRRLFRWRTYDASEFEDFTVGKREAMRPWAKEWWWGPGSAAFDAYDTLDAVTTIGTTDAGGRCADCGGRRSVPACKCPPAAHAAPAPIAVPPARRLVLADASL